MVTIHRIPQEHVLDGYLRIREELAEAIGKSGNYVSERQVYESLAAGSMWLFLGEVGGEYAGFFIAEPMILNDGPWLNLPFAHANAALGETWKDVSRKSVEEIERMAKEQGYKGVFLSSCRKGYERWAKALGYERDIVRYRKEL